MLVLNRIENEVWCGDKKLTIIKQASKGEGNEVVKVDGLEGSNGQKYVSLSKLKQGINEIETQAREITSYQKYNLTTEEKAQIKEYQSKIDEIIENAKKRYVVKPKLVADPNNMNEQEREAYIKSWEAYIKSLRGE